MHLNEITKSSDLAETQGDVVGRVLDDSGAPLTGAMLLLVEALIK